MRASNSGMDASKQQGKDGWNECEQVTTTTTLTLKPASTTVDYRIEKIYTTHKY
jgi:hypothetical protein